MVPEVDHCVKQAGRTWTAPSIKQAFLSLLRLYIPLSLLLCLAAQIPWVWVDVALSRRWYVNYVPVISGEEWQVDRFYFISLYEEGIRMSSFSYPPAILPQLEAQFNPNAPGTSQNIEADMWRWRGGLVRGGTRYWQYDDPHRVQVPWKTHWGKDQMVWVSHLLPALGVPLLIGLTWLLPPVRRAVAWWGRLLLGLARAITGRQLLQRRGFPVLPAGPTE